MLFKGQEATLYGRHFLVNIALPENLPHGSLSVVKDPRQLRHKLAAYVGIVEETGDKCFLVKPGDKVVVKRWEWQQQNVDEERMIVREVDLIVLDGGAPAPGIIIMKLLRDQVKTNLLMPDGFRQPKPQCLKGEVLRYSKHLMGELKGKEMGGKILHFERSDDDQWAYGDDRIAIRVSPYFQILAIQEREVELHVI